MRTITLALALAITTAAAAQVAPPVATGSQPGSAPSTSAQVAAPVVEKRICKTSIDTGSLIAQHKTCLTRKQWDYVNNENERVARRMVEDNMGKPSGN